MTDYRLDRGDTGVQTIAALRRRLGPRLPAVLVTAEREPFLAVEAQRLDAALLEKPVAEADLRATLLRLLEKRRLRGRAAAE
ncbi:hypothetical protein [Cereibacter changlensis]|uniref:hypothetical protein n=1 Tax=Cereibacter changlensis TaxID=402884 RepID=UPI00145DFCB8|nr:hypothetical protein [Cereibacter changlensis]